MCVDPLHFLTREGENPYQPSYPSVDWSVPGTGGAAATTGTAPLIGSQWGQWPAAWRTGDGLSAADLERRRYAGACAAAALSLNHGYEGVAAAGRPAGLPPLIAAAAYVVISAVVGFVVVQVARIVEDAQTARHVATVAAASEDFRNRLAVERATGVRPAPSPQEQAAAASIASASDSFWTHLGTSTGETVSMLGKAVVVLGALWLLGSMGGKSASTSNANG